MSEITTAEVFQYNDNEFDCINVINFQFHRDEMDHFIPESSRVPHCTSSFSGSQNHHQSF